MAWPRSPLERNGFAFHHGVLLIAFSQPGTPLPPEDYSSSRCDLRAGVLRALASGVGFKHEEFESSASLSRNAPERDQPDHSKSFAVLCSGETITLLSKANSSTCKNRKGDRPSLSRIPTHTCMRWTGFHPLLPSWRALLDTAMVSRCPGATDSTYTPNMSPN